MPAIDLARLKTQAARLAEKFGEPQAFIADLNELLDYYTNRTIRISQVIQRYSLPTYHTPGPVLRQIQSELSPLAENRPVEAVTLTKALWDAGNLESRLLAANLLGRIPSSPAIPALSRLPDWLARSTDKDVRAALLTDALARLRRENPQTFFVILENWLASPRPSYQIWGMQALIPLLQDPSFENLPAVFRILRPAVRAAGPITQVDLQACMAALENVSLTETQAFLREILHDKPSMALLRTIRRILPGLSPELQSALRETLREQGS
jgi:hypothetical protein